MPILELYSWTNEYNLLQKQLKNALKNDSDFGWNYPKKLKDNERLIFLLDDDNNILTVIHISLFDSKLEFSFSYTPIDKRRNGYNKKLRIKNIEHYTKLGITHFMSTPLPGSNSIPLLISLGFEKDDERYVYNVNE